MFIASDSYSQEDRKKSIAETLFKTIESNGIGEAILQYYDIKNKYPEGYSFNEQELNTLGYDLLGMGKIDEAFEIFRLNIEVFPNSSNVYDSYAEACFINKDYEESIKNYRKAFELSDNDKIVWDRIGNVYAKLGDKDLEIEYRKEEFEHIPDSTNISRRFDGSRYPPVIWDPLETWDKLIETYLKYKDREQALAAMNEANKEYPGAGLWRARNKFKEMGVEISNIEDAWERTSFKNEGIDSTGIVALFNEINKGTFGNVNSVVIVKNGKLLTDVYFNGATRYKVQDIRSAAKSITSVLSGIAIDKGYIRSVDEPIMHFFPDFDKRENWDRRKDDITIRHLLMMSSGLDASDNDPSSPGNEGNLYREDWIDYYLNLSYVFKPHEKWIYNSGSSKLMGAIISNASGMNIPEFSQKYLFNPLGIKDVRWFYYPDGRVSTSGYFRILPRDLAKIGQLFLNNGIWDGKQVVSEEWITESTQAHIVSVPFIGMKYGYFWHIETYKEFEGVELVSYSARGNGGNDLHVFPELQLVVVLTASNYDSDVSILQQREMITKYILQTFAKNNEIHPGMFRRKTISLWYLGVCVLLCALSFIIWFTGFGKKRTMDRAKILKKPGIFMKVYIWITGLYCILCSALIALIIFGRDFIDHALNYGIALYYESIVKIILLIVVAISLLIVSQILVTYRVWRSNYWTVYGRFSYSLLTLFNCLVIADVDYIILFIMRF